MKTLRTIGICLLALIAFVAIVWIGDAISHALYPAPAGMDPNNMDSIRAYMDQLPLVAFVIMMLGHAVATFAAVWIVARWTGNSTACIVITVLLTLSGISNLIMLPHPAWFWMDALIYPLFGWLGSRAGAR
jgi:hypothetical protein